MIGTPNLRPEGLSEAPQLPTSLISSLILHIAQQSLQGSLTLHRLEDACDRLEGGTPNDAAGEPDEQQAIEQLPVIEQLHRVARVLEERNHRQMLALDRLDNIV